MNASVRPSGEKRAWRSVRAPSVTWRAGDEPSHGRRPDREPVAVLADARPLDGERDERAVGREPRVVRDGEAVEVVRARGSRQRDPPGARARASRARVGRRRELPPVYPRARGYHRSCDGRRAALLPAGSRAPHPGRPRPDVARAAPRRLRLPGLPVRADLGRAPRVRVRRAGRDRRARATCASSTRPASTWRRGSRSWRGSRSASRRGRRSSTGSSSWSTASGRADDDGLRARLNGQPGRPVALLVFDVVHLDGVWLLRTPLEKRRAQLRRILRPGDEVVVVPAIAGEGRALHDAVSAQGIAGVLARRRTSPYLPGVHSRLWRSILATPAGSAPEPAQATDAAVEASGTAPVLALFRRLPFDDGDEAPLAPERPHEQADRGRLAVEQDARPVDADREQRRERHRDDQQARARARAPRAPPCRPRAARASRTGSTAARTRRTG